MTKISENPTLHEKPLEINTKVSRVLYALFTTMGISYWVFSADKTFGAAIFGLALIFDPFDGKVTFYKRPFYQRAWLIVHAALVFIAFISNFL